MIGHLKAEHRMGRNYLAHHAGDAVNAVLAAAGYNFHLLLRWLELLLSNSSRLKKQRPPFNGAENRKLHGRQLSDIRRSTPCLIARQQVRCCSTTRLVLRS